MIYLTGDTHGRLDRLSSGAWPLGKTLNKRDYVIILGDFGILWDYRDDSFSSYWLNWLDKKPWTTLFLDGNHENFDLINNLQTAQKFGADVGRVTSSIFHLRRGRCYTIDRQTFLTVGGAYSVDRDMRTKGKSWWPEEMLSDEDIKTLINTISKNKVFDYVLTHTCPESIKGQIISNSYSIPDVTSDHLEILDGQIKYKHWYFGHWHTNESFYRHYNDEERSYTCLYESIIKLGEFI